MIIVFFLHFYLDPSQFIPPDHPAKYGHHVADGSLGLHPQRGGLNFGGPPWPVNHGGKVAQVKPLSLVKCYITVGSSDKQ